MIKLTRAREKHLIPTGLMGARLRKKTLKLLREKREKTTLKSKDFKSAYWKPAKERLRMETHNKCAYCEAHTRVVAHGDVEHFRPKSEYWHLAYCYDNYLYACQICNQTYKGNHFPRRGPKLPAPRILKTTSDERLEELKSILHPDPRAIDEGYTLARFKQDCQREEAELIDPYIFDPEPHMAWEADPILKEVSLIPVSDSALSSIMVKAMEKYYGLNREELRALRWEWYDVLLELRDDLAQGDLPPDRLARKKKRVREMMGANRPFAGMVRYFVNSKWRLDVNL